ncbi:Vacuolar protein sorting-associated protein 1 [Mycena sanguinolenta]|uniref:Vacuolar protein sorting-associated protein 1 n=1 Tax=Mycena sanguinolenta TaxID=230812 RepID=A0A8H7CPH2_9AGAR|nr:Vacuolar protein sorting-associated protein 1 [Mycena sanguinolenta]
MAESTGLGVELVSIVNKLQDAFAAVGSNSAQIDLPQICVLGSQSSGKSSVLENIVGRDFLPRGSGIVTRRPLVLQLINRTPSAPSTNGTPRQEEWGEFLHLPGKKFFDFNEIRNEIVRDTEAKTGRNAGISPLPINLRIYSPNVLTLTLVDLPGLTKVPVGDQPRDIEKQIRDMLMTYISRPACIILAVTPANQDLANSEGLKMAREVDPEGLRTIGVLTKIDLMDTGTNVVDILAGRVIPLRLGYVPVVNRGQRDIDGNRSISSALQKERQFFENHPSYRANIKFCGTPFLAQKLNNTLKAHIRNTLPTIKSSISQQHQKLWMELQMLGGPVSAANSANVLSSVITEFTTEFRTTIDGTNAASLSLNELSGGARIAFVFHQLYSTVIKDIDPFDQIKDTDIRSILYSSAGTSPALFIGTAAFEVLVKSQVKRLEEPSLKCCQLVYDELLRILSEILGKMPALKRYPALRERLHSVVLGFFKKSLEPTRKLVSDMVAMQACYINTTHPDFIGGHQAAAIVNERINPARPATPPGARSPKVLPGQLNNGRDLDVEAKKEDPGFFSSFFPSRRRGSRTSVVAAPTTMEAPPAKLSSQAPLNARDTRETQIIRLLITSYFNIVKREMIDTVPKAISLTLIGHATKNIQQELLQELYKPEGMAELLKESEAVVVRRRELTVMVEALDKAEEIVSSV